MHTVVKCSTLYLFVGFRVTGLLIQNRFQDQSVNDAQQENAIETCKILDITLKEIALSDEQWKPFTK